MLMTFNYLACLAVVYRRFIWWWRCVFITLLFFDLYNYGGRVVFCALALALINL
jgi:hypothetical protein